MFMCTDAFYFLEEFGLGLFTWSKDSWQLTPYAMDKRTSYDYALQLTTELTGR